MNNNTVQALQQFTQRYTQLWQTTFEHGPISTQYHAIPSPCIVKTIDMTVYWQPVPIEPALTLYIAESLIGIVIRPEIHQLFGSQFAADMRATFDDMPVCLIQVWNEADFQRLEKNQIAHLQMQKKLKRQPTLFIASVTNNDALISVNNVSGAVVYEDLISGEQKILASSLNQFLAALIPDVLADSKALDK
ncbi:SecY-interacting protein [Utexia brackfieldae]|uniref:SecY-interacting protein n=1 Tax=Utexia brackfieldae TaxID=3074108 RepID=UPI00370D46C1